MKLSNGSLTDIDYIKLFKDKLIITKNLNKMQIQPSSVDLTLSNECYEIKASFLSSTKKVLENLNDIIVKKINLNKGYIFKKNKTYLVKLNERLKLKNNIFGICNPKSSTGRLDVFCRTILDYTDEYEKIPKNYNGEMFIEITSRSFNIKLMTGDSLNQMRLIYNKHLYLKDIELKKTHNKSFLTMNDNNIKILPKFSDGLKISVDLSEINKIKGYVAKKTSKVIYFNKIKFHKIDDFWKPIKSKNERILIKTSNFYILKSKEKIQIPNNMAGEMVPYDTGLGDFRVHYAGFFDPGFGNNFGSYAVLEVKTNEVPFFMEDGQTIARIKYEMLNKNSKLIYGSHINSNYQHQGLALSKHFV
tara:strand:- start:401 stop:1480 length:1080 start_codon:yes stop_codon:yes gene_type:complete